MAKLLLVEDDNNLREIYEARLQAEGYEIVSAKDGEEALVVAKAEKPDLVISDVMMPKISGFEMLDILRNTEELKGVKVIMLTALGQSDDQKRADKLGADRYLVKSQVTLEDIVQTAHELLGDQEQPPGHEQPPSGGQPVPAADSASTAPPAPAAPVAPPAAPQPQPSANPAPTKPAPEPKAPPGQAAGNDSVSATDDKLMADAVDALVAGTDETNNGKAGDAPGTRVSIPVQSKPSGGSAASNTPETAKNQQGKAGETAKPKDADTATASGGTKKIIKPIDTGSKDINKLLAEEQAKEAVGPESDSTLPVKSPPDEGKSGKVTGVAESTAQEEADVEAKIEDFVAGASSEPTTPNTSATSSPPKQLKAISGTPISKEEDNPAATAAKAKADEDKASGAPMSSPSGNTAPEPTKGSGQSTGSKDPDPGSVAL